MITLNRKRYVLIDYINKTCSLNTHAISYQSSNFIINVVGQILLHYVLPILSLTIHNKSQYQV